MSQLFDEDAEQIVIGTILNNNQYFFNINTKLDPIDFFVEKNRVIYQSLISEINNGISVDSLYLISLLKDKELLEKYGNRSYIFQLIEQSSPITFNNHAKRIKDFSIRRQLLTKFKELEKETVSSEVTLQELLGKTEEGIFNISNDYSSNTVHHISDVKDEFSEFLETVQKNKDKGGVTGLATGFSRLDSVTTGFKPGQLIVLAARPGGGKTAFALNIAKNVVLNEKKPVLFFSIEMTKLELLIRLVCSVAFVDASKLLKGHLNEREIKNILSALSRIYNSPLFIDESSDLNTFTLKQNARRLANQLKKDDQEIGLIIVDYLQLMTSAQRKENRQIEVASISRLMKTLAKDLKVPVLSLSQMNRDVEQRKNARPQLSDLRESGSIEQDADIVMFIDREEMYNHELEDSKKGRAEIIIAKHRAGPQDNFYLNFAKEKLHFQDIEDRPEPSQ